MLPRKSPLVWAQAAGTGTPNAHPPSSQLLSNPLGLVAEAKVAAGKSQNSEEFCVCVYGSEEFWSQEGWSEPLFLFALASCKMALDAGSQGRT